MMANRLIFLYHCYSVIDKKEEGKGGEKGGKDKGGKAGGDKKGAEKGGDKKADAKAGGGDKGGKGGDKGGKGGKDKGGKGGKGGKEEKKDEKKEEKKGGDKKEEGKGGEKGGKDKGGKKGKGDKGGKEGEGKEEAKAAAVEEEEEEDTGKHFDPLPEEQDEELLRKLGLLGKSKKRVRKEAYAEKLRGLLNEYKNILLCSVDNVGSNQMQKVRIALRGKAVVLMGKNTVMRKIIRQEVEKNKSFEALLDYIQGNVGFVFTNGDLKEIRKTIQANKVPASAKVGTMAPEDVFIQPGPTGMDPGQTAFFQALQIPTKIARGSIEIINKVHLIKGGEKITVSHVALLQKLNIRPFTYGIIVTHAFEDGSVYEAKLLDVSEKDILEKFLSGARIVGALSLALGIVTIASIGSIFGRATKLMVALALETNTQDQLGIELGSGPAEEAPAEQEEAAKEEEGEKEAEKEEEGEESDGQIGGGLFGAEAED